MPTEAQAMMALAFEQRTANLIAALKLVGTDLTGLPKETVDLWVKMARDINARLGLEDR